MEKSMSKRGLKIGDKRADGSIYAGPSPETGEALFVLGEERVGDGKSLDQVKQDLAERGLRLPTAKEIGVVRLALNIAAGIEPDPTTRLHWAGDQVPDQQEFVIPIRAPK